MSEIGAGVGAQDVGLSAQSIGPEDIREWRSQPDVRRAELLDSLDGARRKLEKQEAFLRDAEAEVERLERELAEVGDDGVVSE